MTKIIIDTYELSDEEIDLLLAELKAEKVSNRDDLSHYLKKYSYMDDPARKCHLLVSPTEKKKSFALPYDM